LRFFRHHEDEVKVVGAKGKVKEYIDIHAVENEAQRIAGQLMKTRICTEKEKSLRNIGIC
jgi:hypothetical protein